MSGEVATAGVSDEELASRREYVAELQGFLTRCQSDVTDVMETLCWTPEHFIKPQKRTACPCNSGHIMSPESITKHVQACQLVKRGCSKEEIEKLLDNSDYFYENAEAVTTVKLDKDSMNSILYDHHVKNNSDMTNRDDSRENKSAFVKGDTLYYGHEKMPLTPEEEAVLLSREDRLGLYEHVAQKTYEDNRRRLNPEDKAKLMADLEEMLKTGDDNQKRPLTHIEELAAMRDYKRRRQSYRAKNVHITKKSYTEIMREVITNQMEIVCKSQEQDTGDIVLERGSQEQFSKPHDSFEGRDRGSSSYRDREKHSYRDRETSSYRDRESSSYRGRDREGSSYRDRDRESSSYRDRDRYRDGSKDKSSYRRDNNRERFSRKEKRRYDDRESSSVRESSSHRNEESETDGSSEDDRDASPTREGESSSHRKKSHHKKRKKKHKHKKKSSRQRKSSSESTEEGEVD